MGVNDYGTGTDKLSAPQLSAWAGSVATVLDNSDIPVNTRLADMAPLDSPAFTNNPTAPTPALTDNDTSIATTAFVAGYAAAKATVGNLLTANQASGGDSLGDTTGFTSAGTLAYTGGVIRGTATTTGTQTLLSMASGPVTVGQVYACVARVKASPVGSQYMTVVPYWMNASNVEISSIAVEVVAGSFTTHTFTGVAPAGADHVKLYVVRGTDAGPQVGDVAELELAGLWAGAGGDWAMPGTPITGLGTRVSRPLTDDRLVEVWNGSAWSVVDYDSGERDVSGSLVNGFTLNGTEGAARVRRQGGMVTVTFNIDPTAATAATFCTMPSGFTPDPGFIYQNVLPVFGNTFAGSVNLPASGAFGWYSYGGATPAPFYLTFTYMTNDAPPTSLPGTLVSSAPA